MTAPARARQAGPVRRRPGTAHAARALRATTAPRARRALHGLAWLVGAVGGMAPVALLGDPAAGVVAGALLGAGAWGWTAPVVVAPWVGAAACSDDDVGTAAALHAVGLTWPRRLVARTLAGGADAVAATATAALTGTLAAVGTALADGGPTMGLRSAPQPDGLALAATLLLAAVAVGGLAAAALVTTPRLLLGLVAAVVATGSTIALAAVVPGAGALVPLTPWLSLWPFDPDDVLAPTLARQVAPGVRLASWTAWAGATAAVAALVRRRTPHPSATPARTRRPTPRRLP